MDSSFTPIPAGPDEFTDCRGHPPWTRGRAPEGEFHTLPPPSPPLTPPTTIQIIATAPGIIADYQTQIEELHPQYEAITNERWGPVKEECEMEMARLEEIDPPHLSTAV